MVFERVVFVCAVFVCAILGSLPQRVRNIRNGRYGPGRRCCRLGVVNQTMPVVLGMRVMIMIMLVIIVMMRRVPVVVGVIVMFVIVRVLVVMAFLSVSMGGLVRPLCRCLQA